MTPRRVTLLGSTGSIGTQALQVVAQNPGRFEVHGLAAGGSDLDLLARQVFENRPEVVAIAHGSAEELLERLGALRGGLRYVPRILTGPEAAAELAAEPVDVVLNGITGSIGLGPTLAALEAGSTLALANKESLIVGGPLVKAAVQRPDQIVPVDSEHSAIAQCLASGRREELRRLVITASGGPFRGRSREELADVTPEQALAHPNFAMGRVVTTNSATLVNKGLEVIEAHLLFDVPFDDIRVVVHPQQQIHSMVEFRDGSTIAQVGPPRMLVPIALGLAWPERLEHVDEATDWRQPQSWEFHPLDDDAFPAVRLAFHVGRLGGIAPAVYNAANEECVEAFHAGRLVFTEIVDVVAEVVEEMTAGRELGELTLDSLLVAEAEARSAAHARIAARAA
ncbi:1-deoxy-D-xylulose 5-phosphate reductoisomerase [Kytococcus aerolatus]|uniref:1-deoxy-D-xylulose 5-phosphate reductoisomerase n=1 Tax=Kytococcus aerolatus TaxID=592308 RepID=A0A212U2A3_9MICO|nr:1-deoxy-D-xylulose-5-phosphate reductoisomerase [Kytococcus aerolatus]SNC72256.1 1-deoxy-D-xylulose 5-phosphate reductoisomerase [Kytococcus aerolatus]